MSPTSMGSIWASFRAGWMDRRGPLQPRDVPGAMPWALAMGCVALWNPGHAGALIVATLAVWAFMRTLLAIVKGRGRALAHGARRLGEVCGLLVSGAVDRRAFSDMDDFNDRWEHAVYGVWTWWIAILAAPLLVGWP